MSTLPFDRLPVHSALAEMRVLASIMMADRPTFTEILGIVRGPDFFLPDHQTLFTVLKEMYDADTWIDAMTVRSRLLAADQLDEIGGIQYLAQILSSVPDAAHGPHHARIVRDAAARRGGRYN